MCLALTGVGGDISRSSGCTYVCTVVVCLYIIVPIPTSLPLPISPVFLYDCSSRELSRDCSECTSLPPELSCGYCSSPMQCLHSTFCNAPSTFIESQQDTSQCPVDFKVSQGMTPCTSLRHF